MKKKGLIISTVVMVVVLIAALTTTTFAWFTQTGKTQIDPVNVSVKAASDLQFGFATDDTFDTSSTPTTFMSGNVSWDSANNKWKDGTKGLGYSLNPNLNVSLQKGVYTGTIASANSVDEDGTQHKIDDWTHKLVAAEGEGSTKPSDTSKIAEAKKNGGSGENGCDYLHFIIGVAPAPGNTSVFGIDCTVEIDLSGNTNSLIGMNAALWYMYRVVDKTSVASAKALFTGTENEATGTGVEQGQFTDKGRTELNSQIGAESKTSITIHVKEAQKAALTSADLYQVELFIFINGYDEDCVTAAAGTSCAINISFVKLEQAGD